MIISSLVHSPLTCTFPVIQSVGHRIQLISAFATLPSSLAINSAIHFHCYFIANCASLLCTSSSPDLIFRDPKPSLYGSQSQCCTLKALLSILCFPYLHLVVTSARFITLLFANHSTSSPRPIPLGSTATGTV